MSRCVWCDREIFRDRCTCTEAPPPELHAGYVRRDRHGGLEREGPLARMEQVAAPGWTLVVDDDDVDGTRSAVYLRHTGGGRVPIGPNVHLRHEVERETGRLLTRVRGAP